MSWFCVQCFAFHRRAELKPACILLLVVQFTFIRSFFCCSSNNSQRCNFFFFIFYLIVLFSFCTQIFLFTRCEVENDNFLHRRAELKPACILLLVVTVTFLTRFFNLPSFRPFSVAQVITVRGFFFFFHFLFNSFAFFLYANFPFHSLWSRERQLPAVTSKQLFAKQTLMCSFLFFLMIWWV